MLPRTVAGWVILILIILFLMYGVTGGLAQAGVIVHALVDGVRTGAQHARSG
jgi:hypothetical protein